MKTLQELLALNEANAKNVPLDDREYVIVKSSDAFIKTGELVDIRFFLDSREAMVWIPSKDPARKELKALEVGKEFSYSNYDTGYDATVKRVK